MRSGPVAELVDALDSKSSSARSVGSSPTRATRNKIPALALFESYGLASLRAIRPGPPEIKYPEWGIFYLSDENRRFETIVDENKRKRSLNLTGWRACEQSDQGHQK